MKGKGKSRGESRYNDNTGRSKTHTPDESKSAPEGEAIGLGGDKSDDAGEFGKARMGPAAATD